MQGTKCMLQHALGLAESHRMVCLQQVCHRCGGQLDAELCEFLHEGRELMRHRRQGSEGACTALHDLGKLRAADLGHLN